MNQIEIIWQSVSGNVCHQLNWIMSHNSVKYINRTESSTVTTLSNISIKLNHESQLCQIHQLNWIMSHNSVKYINRTESSTVTTMIQFNWYIWQSCDCLWFSFIDIFDRVASLGDSVLLIYLTEFWSLMRQFYWYI
jgi:hypothetical protein